MNNAAHSCNVSCVRFFMIYGRIALTFMTESDNMSKSGYIQYPKNISLCVTVMSRHCGIQHIADLSH